MLERLAQNIAADAQFVGQAHLRRQRRADRQLVVDDITANGRNRPVEGALAFDRGPFHEFKSPVLFSIVLLYYN
ncbi:hypothetical protein SDC9_152498 [bioreactor metagenome]|uniref:Uncharacterized protein n=1 Tax=bioreactor metagenome TaxID=1076179 RepID=A0A645ET84_9ZZZZ